MLDLEQEYQQPVETWALDFAPKACRTRTQSAYNSEEIMNGTIFGLDILTFMYEFCLSHDAKAVMTPHAP